MSATSTKTSKKTELRWRCQECGNTFRTAKAAERAMLSVQGCPKCGGADIDLTPPVKRESKGGW